MLICEEVVASRPDELAFGPEASEVRRFSIVLSANKSVFVNHQSVLLRRNRRGLAA